MPVVNGKKYPYTKKGKEKVAEIKAHSKKRKPSKPSMKISEY